MLYVYSGNRMWRTEMGARRKVQREENVNEVFEGMESHSGSFFLTLCLIIWLELSLIKLLI